ncbi:hypothetical protein IC582_002644 [Cucumis melo]
MKQLVEFSNEEAGYVAGDLLRGDVFQFLDNQKNISNKNSTTNRETTSSKQKRKR